MPLTQPYFIKHAFASSASGPHITNPIPDPSTGTARASWVDGFPPLTFTDPNSGGSPPYGADFNGVLYALSANNQWAQAGGPWVFNSTFATAIGGYQPGMVITSSDGAKSYLCISANNTSDPDAGPLGAYANWAPWGGIVAGNGQYAADTGASNAYVMATHPPLIRYDQGQRLVMKATHTNSGAATLDAGAGAIALHRNDGAALVAGDLANGGTYPIIYDGAFFKLQCPVQSQFVGATASAAPANPTGTSSLSAKMMGLAIALTPVKSGKVLVTITGRGQFTGGSTGESVALYTGTGTAPTNGASLTGTLIGQFATVALTDDSFALTGVVSGLAIGAASWFDLALNTVTAGSSAVVDLNFSAMEA